MSDQQKTQMQLLMEKRKKQQEEAENSKNHTPIDYENVKYMGIVVKEGKEKNNDYKVFRPIGLPYPIRREPTDPKFILASKLLKDDGSGYSIIRWKSIEKNGKVIPDPEFPLAKLYNMVTEGKWEDYPEPIFDRETGKEKKGEYKYFHKDTDVYIKVKALWGNTKKKDNPKSEQYPESFTPSGIVVMNAIDRKDDWCKINKHTKVPTKRIDISRIKDAEGNEKVIEFTNIPGLPASTDISYYAGAYDKMESLCAETSGAFENADYIMRVSGKDYEVSNSIKGIYNELPTVKDYVVKDMDLTEEEKTYKMYDLDDIFDDDIDIQCSKLAERHIGLFKLADAEIGIKKGIDLTTELQKRAEIGKKKLQEKAIKKQAEKQVETGSVKKEDITVSTEQKQQEPVLEQRQERQARSVVTDTVKVESKTEQSIEEQCKIYLTHWLTGDDLDREAYIDCIDHFEADGKIIWKENKITSIILCDKGCGKEIPSTSYTCAVCGFKY